MLCCGTAIDRCGQACERVYISKLWPMMPGTAASRLICGRSFEPKVNRHSHNKSAAAAAATLQCEWRCGLAISAVLYVVL